MKHYVPEISVQQSPQDLSPSEELAIILGCCVLGATALSVILLCIFP